MLPTESNRRASLLDGVVQNKTRGSTGEAGAGWFRLERTRGLHD